MTRFPFLLQHKGLLIFEMKQPLFWKNGHICPSLFPTRGGVSGVLWGGVGVLAAAQGGTICLFYVHESMMFFKFCGLFMDVFRAMDRAMRP